MARKFLRKIKRRQQDDRQRHRLDRQIKALNQQDLPVNNDSIIRTLQLLHNQLDNDSTSDEETASSTEWLLQTEGITDFAQTIEQPQPDPEPPSSLELLNEEEDQWLDDVMSNVNSASIKAM